MIVAASNKDSNRAGNRMPTHLRDRFMTVEVEADVDDFVAYANTKGIDPMITGFVRAAELLSKFERDALACPSPRGWDKVNTILSWGLDPVPNCRHRLSDRRGRCGDSWLSSDR